MSRIVDYPNLLPNETAWDRDEETIYIQWPCGECDRGLLYAPARFCGACRGSGYATRVVPRHECESSGSDA